MSPIAHRALLYFTAFRWQRRLAMVGFALLAVGLALNVGSAEWGSALALTGFACALLPAAVGSGFLLRALSSPRSQRLVPRFRRDMLAAVVLVVAILAAGAGLSAWWLAAEPSVGVLLEGFSLGALVGTIALLWGFAVTGPPLQTLLLLLATYGVGAVASPALFDRAWLPERPALAAVPVCALLWLAFGTWYRHVRTIGSLGIFQSLALPTSVVTATSAKSGPPSLGLYLGDRLPWSDSRRFAALTALAAVAAALVWVLDRLDRRLEFPSSTLLNVPLIVAFLGLPRVYRMVRHSRALWLRTPGLRVEVFRVCEREALRDVTWNVAFASLLISGFVLARPSLGWAMLPWALLLYLATGLVLAYVGLMLVRGPRPIDVTVGLLLAALSLVALRPLGATPTQPLHVALIISLEIVSAFTLRSIAMRRWTGIDWLTLRAPRAAARSN